VADPVLGNGGEVDKKALQDWRTNYQGKAVKADAAYQVVKDIAARGDKGATPAQDTLAVRLAMQEAAGLSPTSGAGGRGGMDMGAFKNIMGGRGLADDKIALIQKLANGKPITQTQRIQLRDSMQEYHRATWRAAIDQGKNIGLAPQYAMPEGTPGRDKVLQEYGIAPPTPTPTPTPPGGQKPPSLPRPLGDLKRYPVRPGKNGGSEQWNGAQYVPVQQ
jgi:hypothetical protein